MTTRMTTSRKKISMRTSRRWNKVEVRMERTVECPRCQHRFQLMEATAGEYSTHGVCSSCGNEGEMPVPEDLIMAQHRVVDKVFGSR
jgi:transcription elongation factor Elf1